MMMSKRLGILSAMLWEAEIIKKNIIKDGWIKKSTGLFFKQDKEIIFFFTGVGKKNIKRNLARFFENYRPTHILFIGLAGALKKELKVGDIINPEVVYSSWDNKAIRCNFLEDNYYNNILTIDRIAHKKDKILYASQFPNIQAVDMESFFIAKECSLRKIDLTIIKTISDTLRCWSFLLISPPCLCRYGHASCQFQGGPIARGG